MVAAPPQLHLLFFFSYFYNSHPLCSVILETGPGQVHLYHCLSRFVRLLLESPTKKQKNIQDEKEEMK